MIILLLVYIYESIQLFDNLDPLHLQETTFVILDCNLQNYTFSLPNPLKIQPIQDSCDYIILIQYSQQIQMIIKMYKIYHQASQQHRLILLQLLKVFHISIHLIFLDYLINRNVLKKTFVPRCIKSLTYSFDSHH